MLSRAIVLVQVALAFPESGLFSEANRTWINGALIDVVTSTAYRELQAKWFSALGDLVDPSGEPVEWPMVTITLILVVVYLFLQFTLMVRSTAKIVEGDSQNVTRSKTGLTVAAVKKARMPQHRTVLLAASIRSSSQRTFLRVQSSLDPMPILPKSPTPSHARHTPSHTHVLSAALWQWVQAMEPARRVNVTSEQVSRLESKLDELLKLQSPTSNGWPLASIK